MLDRTTGLADLAGELRALPGMRSEDVQEVASSSPHDSWPAGYKPQFAAGEHAPVTVAPRTAEAVAGIVRWAAGSGRTIATRGLGSNVVGAGRAESDVVLSTTGLTGVRDFDQEAQIVRVGAGTAGGELEAWLNEKGFTLGQYPQSLHISTVGGWVATRATGSHSAMYGGFEAALCGMTLVLPSGELLEFTPRVRPAGGIDGLAVLLGAEGSLGVVCEVALVVHRMRADRRLCAVFPSLHEGLDAQRRLIQGRYPLGLVRLYNRAETEHIAPGLGRGCLLIVTTRSPEELAGSHTDAMAAVIAGCGGEAVDPEIAEPWFQRRYAVSDLMERGNSTPGEMFDTIEVSLPWSTAGACADELEASMPAFAQPFYQHFSHVYEAGVCLYMMLYLSGDDDEDVLDRWRQAWAHALEVVRRHRGTIGHHHGIGAVRSGEYAASADGRLHALIRDGVDPKRTLTARLLGGESATVAPR